MTLATVLTRVSVSRGDKVRYLPNFADPYRDEMAELIEIIDTSTHPLQQGIEGTPFWFRVRFLKDDIEKTLPTTRFLLEEKRMSIARAG
mgnify:CR=1 FL=1